MELYALKDRLYSARWWKSWLQVVAGCLVMAAGFVFFINPYRIVPGGVYGMGVVLHQIFPSIQVGTFGLMFDVPLLIIATWVFGRSFGTRTIVAAVLTPLIMNAMTFLVGENPAQMFDGHIDLSNDTIIACIFGGVLIGIGVGLVVRARATTGGSDIVAMLLTRFTNLTFSRGIFLVDSLVVICGMIVLADWRLPLYSLVTIYVSSRTIDYVIEGASFDKLLFIISERNRDITNFILYEMGRGATYIKSSGPYTHRDRDMIFLVVSRREVSTVQLKIKEIDPQAFVVVVNAYETFGDGFRKFPDHKI